MQLHKLYKQQINEGKGNKAHSLHGITMLGFCQTLSQVSTNVHSANQGHTSLAKSARPLPINVSRVFLSVLLLIIMLNTFSCKVMRKYGQCLKTNMP